MNQRSDTPFKVFRIQASPFAPSAYAICAAYRNAGGYLKSESYLLIQTSATQGAAFGTKTSYSNDAGPDCPVVVDEAFALDQAIQQAETEYSVRMQELHARSMEKYSWHKATFDEIAPHRLVAVWAHTPLSSQLLSIAATTQCELLSTFINALRSLPKVQHTPLTL